MIFHLYMMLKLNQGLNYNREDSTLNSLVLYALETSFDSDRRTHARPIASETEFHFGFRSLLRMVLECV